MWSNQAMPHARGRSRMIGWLAALACALAACSLEVAELPPRGAGDDQDGRPDDGDRADAGQDAEASCTGGRPTCTAWNERRYCPAAVAVGAQDGGWVTE